MSARLRSVRGGVLGMCVVFAASAACEPQPETTPMTTRSQAPLLIAHRGASAYAPEHTLEAYRLGIEQGADFIEPDLQITRDGVLVCLHDLTLERTTDVEEIFPDRYREEAERGRTVRRWYASDFTLEELRRLDAGSWFGEAFAGARIPTFAEAVELARGRAGIYPETKAPEVYGELGFSMERLLVEALEEAGLARPGADPATPVVIQSFSEESLQVLREELGVRLPLVFLISDPEAGPLPPDLTGAPSAGAGAGSRGTWLSAEGLEVIAEFAEGIGPAKGLLLERPEIVRWAHEAGLDVVPYTFRSDDPGDFADVTAEMHHFLYELEVDGLFTNNPDLFPRAGS